MSAAANAKNKALAATRSHRGSAPPPEDAAVSVDVTVCTSPEELWSADGELIISLQEKNARKQDGKDGLLGGCATPEAYYIRNAALGFFLRNLPYFK
jgi:hypothetical protein